MKRFFTYFAVCFSVILAFQFCNSAEKQTDQQTATPDTVATATAEQPKSSAALFICNQFNGSLSEQIEGSEYMGDAYRCNVEMQYDMMIQGRFNELRSTDKFDRYNSGGWRDIIVNNTRYKRMPYSMDEGSGDVFVPNLEFEDQQKTDYLIITQ